MNDILSQNEIDDLLNALNTGEINVDQIAITNKENKITNHNFRRPSKFAKDHLKTLNMIYDNYARLVTNFLTGYLRTLVQVEVVTVETLAYNDFSNSIANPAILAIVDFSPLQGSIIFEMSPQIAYSLIDRILGGKGNTMEKVREFTEIEIALIERLIIQTLNLMKEPWENVVTIRPRLEKIETNTQFAQIISPNEMVALVTLSVNIGGVEGMINICLPHLVVEPILSKLSTKFWFSTIEKEATQESKFAIERKIQSTEVPVKAILGRATITVNDCIGLQPGDVLQLNTKADDNLEIMIGELTKFYGKPGVKKNKVAVKITKVIKREDD